MPNTSASGACRLLVPGEARQTTIYLYAMTKRTNPLPFVIKLRKAGFNSLRYKASLCTQTYRIDSTFSVNVMVCMSFNDSIRAQFDQDVSINAKSSFRVENPVATATAAVCARDLDAGVDNILVQHRIVPVL